MLEEYNKDPNFHGYFDTENFMEYIFSGFDVPLPRSIKLEVIQKFGKPRKMKLDEIIYENEFAKVTQGVPIWESQVIHFQQEED